MALYTIADQITRPKVWSRATLLETRACMEQRLCHVNSKPSSRDEAQDLITRIDEELARRKKVGQLF